ncbi:response regulator [Rhodospira trueperi]|uniref:Two-component system, chemotaxis family, response regulator CheY n=1 Tax=Rhodospira trueperi TaxID=69960 RepID=A0A1G7HB24_9PROT|nr:response regulator [Rhodospira trueperi]SDE97618.1 two-component system, chemotaxis family, response regulator CheY [Rhodospira trueperi]
MKSVLLVDDSDTIRASVSDILTRNGLKAETAKDGKDALGKLNGFKADLIITDLNMPVMDGLALIKEIRKLPAYRFTPVLMLTTESQQAKRDEARAAGATGWLVKPVKPDDLMAVVRKVVPGA